MTTPSLPAHLASRVEGLPFREREPDEIVGNIVGRLPDSRLVWLQDYAGSDETGADLYSTWGVARPTEEEHVAAAVAAARPGRAGWKERAAATARAEYRAVEAARRERAGFEARRAVYAAIDAAAAAARAEEDRTATVRLRHVYGRSYFGSGGAYGAVGLLNAEVAERKDTGFVYGPSAVRVIDRSLPAEVWCSGGDCIGEGRRWREAYRWDPIAQRWAR